MDKPKTKTFIVYEDVDIDDLDLWAGGIAYKIGDQVNIEEVAQECRKNNSDEEFDQKKWGSVPDKEHSCTIRKPGFKELNAALSSMTNINGDLDFGGGGKVIFETCKVKASPALIEANGVLLLSLCLRLGNQYLRPYNVELKKN